MQLDRVARVVSTGCQGTPKRLPGDGLKVGVHVGYESAAGGKRKARYGGALFSIAVGDIHLRLMRLSHNWGSRCSRELLTCSNQQMNWIGSPSWTALIAPLQQW